MNHIWSIITLWFFFLDDHVWGSVWELSTSDLPNLDEQEGVSQKRYQPIEMYVTTLSGDQLKCRTYQMLNLTREDCRPSPQYLSVMIMGAEECGIPHEYIDKLKAVEHNGYSGPVELYDKIMESRRQNTTSTQTQKL